MPATPAPAAPQFGDLNQRRVLVTGSTKGIGLAAARLLAASGARVGLNGSASQAPDGLLASFDGLPGEVAYVGGDLSRGSGCEAVVAAFVAKFGGMDVLVNNAGGLVGRRGVEAQDDAFYDAVMDLNVRSALMVTRFAVPHLRQSAQQTGQTASVISTGSIAAREGGGPGAAIYSASKAWLMAAQRNWVKELTKDNIRFNMVSPGSIVTAFHADKTQEVLDRISGTIPMGRFGQPEECAPMYAFLASHACSGYITGQVFDVNGGQFCP